MATSQSHHGVLVRVAHCGVLIRGAAGSGKSQLGLELIDRGHQFIADDLVQIERHEQALSGHGVDEASEFLALRCGIVIPVAKRFGDHSVLPQSSIDLVVEPGPALTPLDTIPETQILGLNRPLHYLQSLPGAAVCVEALAANWTDRQNGYHAEKDLSERQAKRLEVSA